MGKGNSCKVKHIIHILSLLLLLISNTLCFYKNVPFAYKKKIAWEKLIRMERAGRSGSVSSELFSRCLINQF